MTFPLVQEKIPKTSSPFFIKKGNALTRVDAKDIFYVEVSGKYSVLHAKQGNFLIQKSLKEIKQLLQHVGFVRTHRNYLLNIASIQQIRLDDKHVLLTDGRSVPFSQNFKAEILAQLQVLK